MIAADFAGEEEFGAIVTFDSLPHKNFSMPSSVDFGRVYVSYASLNGCLDGLNISLIVVVGIVSLLAAHAPGA